MANNFRTGILITGDAKGGVRAVQLSRAELAKLNTSQRRAQQGTRAFRGEVERTTKSLGSMQSLARRAAAAVAAIGVGRTVIQGVRTIADFSQEISTLAAVTQKSVDQIQPLVEEIKRLGASTRFSASQAAQGATFLARAGFTTDEVLQSLASTLSLAQAGALDLGAAADIASNVVQGFQLSVSETSRVVDVLALAANSSNTNVEQLGEALRDAGPPAVAVGESIESAAAAVSALSDAGFQGSRAGTALRQILIKLESEGGRLSVQMNGLVPVLREVRDRFANLGDEQSRLSAASELVGDRQAASLLVLVDSIDKIGELTEKYEAAEGAAAKAAETMDKNLNGALLATASAFEANILAIGDLGGNDGLTRFFNSLADALRFTAENMETVTDVAVVAATVFAVRYVPALQASIVTTIAATRESIRYQATLASMAGVSRTAAVGITALTTAARGLRAVMAFLGGPVGVILTVASVLLTFSTNAKTAENRTNDLAEALKNAAKGFNDLEKAGKRAAQIKVQDTIVAIRDEILAVRRELAGGGDTLFNATAGRFGSRRSNDETLALQQRLTFLNQQLAEARSLLLDMADGSVKAGDGMKSIGDNAKVTQTQINRLAAKGRQLFDELSNVAELKLDFDDSQREIDRLAAEGRRLFDEIARGGEQAAVRTAAAFNAAGQQITGVLEGVGRDIVTGRGGGFDLRSIAGSILTGGNAGGGGGGGGLLGGALGLLGLGGSANAFGQAVGNFVFENINQRIGSAIFRSSTTGALAGNPGNLLGSLGAGFVGNLGGNFLGEALFGKQAESSIGSIVGGLLGAPGGPLGTFVGSLIGSLADVAFGGDGLKRFNAGIVQGSAVGTLDADRVGPVVTGASGLRLQTFNRRAGVEGDQASQAFLETVRGLDAALTSLSTVAGVNVDFSRVTLGGTVADAGRTGRGAFFGLKGFNGVEGSLEEAADNFVRAWLSEVNDQLPRRVRDILRGVDGTAQELVTAFEAAVSIDKLVGLDVVRRTDEALRELGQANLTMIALYDELTETVLQAASELDGSVDSIVSLNSALTDQKTIAVQLAAAYRSVGIEIDAVLGNTIQRIRESVLTEEQLYNVRRQQIADITAQIPGTVDPEALRSLGLEAERLISEVFSGLAPEQQEQVAGGFIQTLQDLNTLIDQQLTAGAAQLAQREAGVNQAVDLDLRSLGSTTQAVNQQMQEFGDTMAAVTASAQLTAEQLRRIQEQLASLQFNTGAGLRSELVSV